MITKLDRNFFDSCDGIARRNFLKIGSIAGLSLPQLLKAEKALGTGSSDKSIIMVYLAGGPSHIDTFDPKDDAPSEIRGEFDSISTAAPGVRISECLPGIAKQMDQCSIIRSIADTHNSHSSFHVMTGRSKKEMQPVGGWPSLGSVVSKVQGSRLGTPAYVDLGGGISGGGFLGTAHSGFKTNGKGRYDMAKQSRFDKRYASRENLLKSFDSLRRDCDQSGSMEGLDAFNSQAFDLINSERLANALDLKNEKPETIERYGKKGQNFLLARRVVEAGARFVTVSTGGWDTHRDNFQNLRASRLPELDRGVSNLIRDLRDRAMLDDVTVVVWGEFGRTPKINGNAGRDHWNRVMSVFLAGGGMKNGQVIGASDPKGGEPADRPVYLGEVMATLYKNLGIDVSKQQLTDLSGRPQYLVDNGFGPISELVG
ncbi:MAG: DUF1501 domain-containing protein [Opitutae bacterium]|nr:DUF1501 domain-containing protein [Opitutae bacterium]